MKKTKRYLYVALAAALGLSAASCLQQSVEAPAPPRAALSPPAGAASGSADVTATTPEGTGSSDQFTHVLAVREVDPSRGRLAGGTVVEIKGSNFTGATAVMFGSNAATSFTVNSDHKITATSPAGAALGPVDVTVTTPEGTSVVSTSDVFTYAVLLPVVRELDPSSGRLAGGTVVEIKGSNFTGATAVMFGSIAATTFMVNSDHKITATSPAGAALGPVDVTVTTPEGTSVLSTSDLFTYAVFLPVVRDVDPSRGRLAGGTVVEIKGSNFTGATAVMFGSIAATTFTVNSDHKITATSPAGAALGSVDVTVTTPEGTSVLSTSDLFTYAVFLPVVRDVDPSRGRLAGGTVVEIKGSNFTGATAVMFGSIAATTFTVNSDHKITATSPAGAALGAVDVTVTTPEGTSVLSTSDLFTYAVILPVVRDVDPSRGPLAGGTVVEIEGSNFTGATAVMFGSIAATTFTVNSDHKITATSPAGAALGAVDVTVTTPEGTSVLSASDLFTYAIILPIVREIEPSGGLLAGGTVVKIEGANFNGATAVMFGSNAATSFTVVSNRKITATSPAGAAFGSVDVTVTSPEGTSVLSPSDLFTYRAVSSPHQITDR